MNRTRCSGILLHPTSLPGPHGIGDLGPEADRWLDWLAEAGCTFWQILPLGPTGYGDSPYSCFSAFAGNPYLVCPELLVTEGFLDAADLVRAPDFPEDRVDFSRVLPWKLGLLDRAFDRFRRRAPRRQPRSLPLLPAGARRLARRLRPVHGPQGGSRRRAVDPVAGAAAPARSHRPGRGVRRRSPSKWTGKPSASSSSSSSGTACGSRLAAGGCASWATPRSTWRRTAPTSGPTRRCSSWTPT